MKFFVFIVLQLLFMGCNSKDIEPSPQATPVKNDKGMEEEEPNPTPNDTLTVSYLALGDSYTIGQSVPESDRYPLQLQTELKKDNIALSEVKIIARTGWTTGDLIYAIDQEDLKNSYDVVSLLIGVNNQYQGQNIEDYTTDFKTLLNTAIRLAGGNKEKVFVLSIPDYSVTPFAAYSDTEKIAKEIAEYNTINREITENAGIKYFDITPISLKAKDDASLLANDGLHPSGKMYGEWVELVLPEVEELLR